jgi:hypothetical protein
MRPGVSISVVALLAIAYLVNALFNHTEPGLALKDTGRWYLLLFYLPFGIVLPALLLGTLRTGDHTGVVRPPFGRRDLVGVPIAFVLGVILTAVPLGRLLAVDAGWLEVHRLFALLLVASLAEVLLFLGVAGNAVAVALFARGWRRVPCIGLALVVSSVLFGLFHFSYPVPWNTAQTAGFLALVWVGVALVYFATGSLLGAVLFNNLMALVGFVQRGLTLPGSAAEGWLRGLLGVVLAILLVGWMVRRRAGQDARPSGTIEPEPHDRPG